MTMVSSVYAGGPVRDEGLTGPPGYRGVGLDLGHALQHTVRVAALGGQLRVVAEFGDERVLTGQLLPHRALLVDVLPADVRVELQLRLVREPHRLRVAVEVGEEGDVAVGRREGEVTEAAREVGLVDVLPHRLQG